MEILRGSMPIVVTVNGTAAPCRPRNAKRLMKYKYAKTQSERQESGTDYTEFYVNHSYLNITEWGANDVEHDPKWLGLSGSPTKVKAIESVVFTAKESKKLTSNDVEIEEMMKELIVNHTIG